MAPPRTTELAGTVVKRSSRRDGRERGAPLARCTVCTTPFFDCVQACSTASVPIGGLPRLLEIHRRPLPPPTVPPPWQVYPHPQLHVPLCVYCYEGVAARSPGRGPGAAAAAAADAEPHHEMRRALTPPAAAAADASAAAEPAAAGGVSARRIS